MSTRGQARRGRRRSFRRRLLLAFTLVAGTSGLVLAVVSYVLIDAYRVRTSREQALDKVRLSLVGAPPSFSLSDFEDQLGAYRQRGGFETVVLQGDVVFSSTDQIGAKDVPPELRSDVHPGEIVDQIAEVTGRSQLVVGGISPGGSAELYFFFDRSDLLRTLSDVRRALGLSWLLTTAGAAAVGAIVARRTLRPVGEAARAAQALADGDMEARLAPGGDDEFGRLARSFNDMADALEVKIDELSEAAARERRLTADVAHELRTPLSGIVTLASLVEQELHALPAERRRPAELLVANTERLRNLVLELLELARLDAQQESVNLDPVSVVELLELAAAPSPGCEVLPADGGDQLIVLADRSRFNRVVANLVANAMDHGGGEVQLLARRDGADVVVEVRDRGPGIDEADLPHIFDRFFKSDRSRSSGGSGMGLAIALQQARLQGGELEAGNRAGGGAWFTFRLPQADAEHS